MIPSLRGSVLRDRRVLIKLLIARLVWASQKRLKQAITFNLEDLSLRAKIEKP